MPVQNVAVSWHVARLLLALLAVGWVPVGLAGSESVEHTAFLVVRLVGGLFSFPLVPVVRLVHFAGRSTIPTGPAAEKMFATWSTLLAVLDTMLIAFDKAESVSTFFTNSSPKWSALAFVNFPFPYYFREGCIDSRAISLILLSEMRLLALPRRTRAH